MTESKIKALRGHKVLLIPYIIEKAASVAYDKLLLMRSKGVKTNIWDMTEGRGDESLKKVDLYNKDLEDFFWELFF